MLRRFARSSFNRKQIQRRAERTILHWGLPILIGALATAGQAIAQPARTLRAGAKIVDITPCKFPVIVNAMFEERSAEKAVDPLTVRSLVLDDGATRIAIVVVDTCMLPRELIDRAKTTASEKCGIPPERMLISATHTHSAPAAMGCLGSRADPDYAAWLPEQIATAIVQAASALEPVRIGWISVDDWEHTFNRRWIRRPDRMLEDPFGVRNVRAHMHPGHESADVVGPSGPVDPGLSLLAVQTLDGRPRALLANYSQHYYGSPLLSADYFGAFARTIAGKLGAAPDFVAMMSQGTSGDLMWMDYSAPRKDPGYVAYAEAIAQRAHAAYEKVQWREWAPLRMAEQKLSLAFRLPDAKRLATARETEARLNGRPPRSHAEIYALEALHLHARPSAELKLQAIRIGELGIVAIPNEVFALTGLKIKGASPLQPTFTIGLANGAEGYIPPPEQHALGGYTTWPARTAGLVAEAEPQIVDAVLSLLASVAEKPRRTLAPPNGVFARALLESKPAAYWRLEDTAGNVARDETAFHRDGRYESGVALWLPGVDARAGFITPRPSAPNAFSEDHSNRAVHFAGGRMKTEVPDLGQIYSAEFWFWNGLPTDAREVTGYLVSRGPDGAAGCPGDHLGIGGSLRPDLRGRLFFFNGNERNEILAGRTAVAWREWHHVVLVRDGKKVTVWLNGNPDPEISGACEVTRSNAESPVFFGGRSDRFANFEGKLDEIALYDRALTQDEVAAHYRASGLPAKPMAPKIGQANDPLSPADSLKKMRVRSGFRAELVAAEPLVLDPVAIDWDESGRLWVVEMSDYPLGMDNKGAPGGRIRVLEDLDANGVYDRSTLFADGLHMPTGLLTWRGGVLVTTAPEIIFLKDTNGDGRADLRELLLSGFLVGNPQLRVNGLRWGLDSWVYCAAGGHHGNYGASTRIHSTRARRDVAVGSRDLRFRPDSGELQAASGPSQFGRNRDERGRWFGTQNSFPLWHYVLPDHYLGRNPHLAAPEPIVQVVTPKNPQVYPALPPDKRYHSFEEAGHFTSACSGMIYGDDLLFPRNEIGHAFICEPFHNLVHHSEIRDDGVTFRGRRAEAERTTEFVSSEDRWFRPVMIRTGPDGALWIVDMYRSMIEHPEWLPPEGRAELLPQYRRGDDRGRLYRIVPVNASPRSVPRLNELNGHDLVAALDSSNSWTRDKIQQLLFCRNERAVAPALEKLARESGNPLARLQALCTLDSLDALSAEIVESALADSDAGVRENALRLAETAGHGIGAATKLLRDPSAKVRLQLAFALGQWEDPEAGKALATLLLSEHEQPFIVAAALSSALPHRHEIFTAAAKVAGEPLKKLAPALFAIALGLNDRDGTRQLLTPMLEGTGSVAQVEMFGDFLNAVRRARSSLARLASQDDALSQTLQSTDRLFAFARAAATDPARPLPERVSVATVLSRHPNYVDEAIPLLAAWLTPAVPHGIQRAVIEALAATGRDQATLLFFRAFPSLAPDARNAVLDQLLSREDWALQLLEQIQEGRLAASAIDAARRGRVTKHPTATIRTRALQVFAESGSTVPAQRIEQFREALSLQGNARQGAVLFEQRCASCHRRGATGNDIGPDIRSVISHEAARLLASIIDPSNDVQPGFYAYHCRLETGEEIYGMISAETETALTFKLVDATTRTVLRKEIAQLQNSNRSLMPDGLETGLTPQEMADLIALLRSPVP